MAAKNENGACDLPEEIWFHAISYLTAVQDILHLGSTCKRLYELTNENIIWRRRLKADNRHLLLLPRTSTSYTGYTVNRAYIASCSSDNNEVLEDEPGIWKKLYLKASHAMSFGNRHHRGFSSLAGERLCAEFVVNPSATNTAAKRLRMRHVEHFRSLFQSQFPVRSKSPARARLHSVCSLWFSCSASCCPCF